MGVHVHSGYLYAAQLQQGAGREAVTACAELPENAPGALLGGLRRLFDSGPFRGRRVVTALPAADVEVRPLRLPPGISIKDAGFRQALLAEARSSLLYDPNEAVLDYLPFPEEATDSEQRHTVLLISSRRERVNRFLATFREAGLRCEHLEVAPCAATRALGKRSGCYAMVDIDRHQTVISIAQEGCMRFSRTVKSGYDVWRQALCQAMDLAEEVAIDLLWEHGVAPDGEHVYDLERAFAAEPVQPGAVSTKVFEICGRGMENLVKEVRRTMDYFALLPGGGAVREIVLLGDILPKGLDQLFELRLKMDTVIATPERLIRLDAPPPLQPQARERARAEHRAAARWTVATGLAMRGN
ncbi:MAG: pilus assembly protein PilM [Candidatus Hydrogenedentes bacterium]|nr:pilus assembly protein PilM [Candidatus Hydrogenedentota bacterium]